jgi:transcriptional regulator of acetoin/glycerol metabolism
MSDASDDAELSTATASDLQEEPPLTILRWVCPGCEQPTALSDRTVVIGRDPDCTTQLASARVSRKHADVRRNADGYLVRDLDSKNGVFVNATRVKKALLRVGDVLRVGDFIAVVEAISPPELPGFRDLGYGVFGGPALRRVLRRANELAPQPLDLILIGETGTGKKTLARAIHRLSGRSGSCVVVDARALPEDALAYELFGPAASDDVAPASMGRPQVPRAGTLVLEEVTALPPDLQKRLAVSRGASAHVARHGDSDFRLIGTNREPLSERGPRFFDPELRARLEAAIIAVPPLRQRRADIVPLFVRLFARHSQNADITLEVELLEHLCLLAWPMNVLELDDVAYRLAARYSSESELKLRHFLELTGRLDSASRGAPRAAPRRYVLTYSHTEILALNTALERNRGNLTKAAGDLGITRAKAYRMLRRAKSQR